MRKVSLTEVEARAETIAGLLLKAFPAYRPILIYGVPRGGICAALAISASPFAGEYIKITEDAPSAHAFVDDIVASGGTRDRYLEAYGERPFMALFDCQADFGGEWVVFPWEETLVGSADDIPLRLLQLIGEDVTREGLRETPRRFLEAWQFYTQGYKVDPDAVLKDFADGGEAYDQMIVQRDIPVWSTCEHHLAPFFGHAHIGYVPDGRIVGLSKLYRLVDIFARRLQVQERLTNDVASCLDRVLKPQGVGVVLECRHTCMEARGIQRHGIVTVTSAMHGVLRENIATREEFMRLIEGGDPR